MRPCKSKITFHLKNYYNNLNITEVTVTSYGIELKVMNKYVLANPILFLSILSSLLTLSSRALNSIRDQVNSILHFINIKRGSLLKILKKQKVSSFE